MIQFQSRFPRIVIALVFLLAVGGIFIGQDKPKEAPKPGVVYAPAETPNPARDQLVEKLIHYRTIGDVENAQKILDILFPSSGGQDLPPSYPPPRPLGKDEINTDGPGSQWAGTDVPIMASSDNEKNPTIIRILGAAPAPKMIAIAEHWTGTTAPSSIQVNKSTYYGQDWNGEWAVGGYYPCSWPRANQFQDNRYGFVFQYQISATNYDLYFASLPHEGPLTSYLLTSIDVTTDHTIHPALTSDYTEWPGETYLYVVYYKVTGTSGQLIFRLSTNLGVTWLAPQVLATIPVLPSNPYCSIAYGGGNMFVAYTYNENFTGSDIAVVKSVDFGASWSAPVVVANDIRDEITPDITVVNSNYAFLIYDRVFASFDHDPFYAYTTNGGTTWATGNALDFSGYDDRFPTIKAYTDGGATKVYAAYARAALWAIIREAPAFTSPTTWTLGTNVKNSGNTTSNNDPCLVVPKATPGGTPGVGVAWCEVLGGQYNLSFNADWLPISVLVPTVTTTAASAITSTSATTGGEVISDGGVVVTTRGVCVSTAPNPTIANAHTHDGTGTGVFASSLTGCTPGTTYHIRGYATNSAGTGYGADLTFTTLPMALPPTVTTTTISSLTKTTAMTGGNVTSAGSAAVTDRGVCVSIAANPTIANAHTHNGAGTGVFVSSLTGCTPGETYHARAYATSTAGTAYGNDIWFRALGGTKSDFNADGQSDILWRNMTTGENAVWFMGYTMSGVTNLQMTGLQNMFPGAGTVLETGDLFKGKPGIVYLDPREGMKNANPTSPPAISVEPMGARGLEMKPLTSVSPFQGGITILGLTRTSVSSLPSLTDFNWVLAGTGDFNGDGWPDFVLRNMVTGDNGVWYIVAGTRIGADYMPSVTDLNWKIVGTGDFNGDKCSDLVWRNSATGENFIWFMNGAARIGGDTPPAVTVPNWTIFGTGDFNGDGKLDFLWHNIVTGENYLWFMDGAMKIGGDTPPMVSDVNWQIGGVDDFNGDGRPDILWRNYVSGENGIWYMNGALRIGTEYVPTIADVAWKIVNR